MSAEGKHLRDHLTDGCWHDSCPFCQQRRRYGGTGLEVRPHFRTLPTSHAARLAAQRPTPAPTEES